MSALARPPVNASEPSSPALRPGLTRIVATIGPASSDAAVVARLIEAGVSIFRMNFSHGALEDHATRLATIRTTAAELGTPTAVLGDLQGPKIRTGKVVDGGIMLERGMTVVFRRGAFVAQSPAPGEPVVLASTLASLVDDVAPGQRLLVNDGAIRLLAVERDGDDLECTVLVGGLLTSSKGINLPESDVSVATITERDWTHVDWAVEQGLDFLALSFVRTADDVHELRRGIRARCAKAGLAEPDPAIVAKIELPRAVRNLESIVDAADAVMVARGDLGVEMDLAEVPLVQKRIIAVTQEYGKPVIVATQMLESMIESPVPTRAEASDVANAIIDKTDAVMLSAETATGKYPVLAVEQMRRIAERTEAWLGARSTASEAPSRLAAERHPTAALAHGAWTLAQDLGATVVVVWSETAGGARYLSQNHFPIPIVAATSDPRMARRMQVLRGVLPVCVEAPPDLAAFTRLVDRYLQETGLARVGDRAILMAGEPLGRSRTTNRIAVLHVGDPRSGFGPGAA